jgi:hypothetical protein
MVGHRIRTEWSNWNDLPGWLQGATYWACLNGGPLDTHDVARVEIGLRMGAGAREVFFREEPRWMVKTLLLLKKAGFITENFSTSEAYKAVAIWWSSKAPHSSDEVSISMVRKLCCGDMSLGKKGHWNWAMERGSTQGKEPRSLIPIDMFHSDMPHDYTSIVLERFTSGKRNPLPNGKAAVIRIPGSYWVVAKEILVSHKNRRFLVYWLKDASVVPGKEVQSFQLDSVLLRNVLGLWPYEKETVPELSKDALKWFASFAPVQPEAGQK